MNYFDRVTFLIIRTCNFYWHRKDSIVDQSARLVPIRTSKVKQQWPRWILGRIGTLDWSVKEAKLRRKKKNGPCYSSSYHIDAQIIELPQQKNYSFRAGTKFWLYVTRPLLVVNPRPLAIVHCIALVWRKTHSTNLSTNLVSSLEIVKVIEIFEV